MANAQRHGTETKARQFGNEKMAAQTLDWLNDPAKDAARERIRALFRDVRIVSSNWSTEFDPDLGVHVTEFRGDTRSFGRAEKRIVATLSRYKFSPGAVIGGGIFLQWVPCSGPDGRYRRKWRPFAVAYDDVQAVFDLLWNNGQTAHRIMECNCGKWFYVRFDHQKYCSSKCREKAFRSTPEWKEYRRGKAREYYWLHKTKNVR